MRNIFIDELIKSARKNKKIILIVNDLGHNVVEKFAKLFPKQFYNLGVAEQSIMSIAAGMALQGHHVFVYSIGNFPTFRCAEQIRNDVDYHNLPVTIVNVGAGVTYGNLGYTHHSIQDLGLMRLFPNILIGTPCDELETSATVKHLLQHPQPSYLRLGRLNTKKIHNKLTKIKEGKWISVKRDKKASSAFLTTGVSAYLVKKLLDKSEFKKFSHFTIPLWGAKLKKKQINQFRNFKKVIIIEDHLEDGGFGSWIREAIGNNIKSCQIITWSLKNDIINKTGSQNYLTNKYLNQPYTIK